MCVHAFRATIATANWERGMRVLCTVSELVRIGIEDEKAGIAFYSKLARKAAAGKLRDVLSHLVSQERYHQKRFEEMLEALGDEAARESYPGEYEAYLRELLESRPFTNEESAAAKAEQCEDDSAAVDLASRFERNTLLFMSEMRRLVPVKERSVVDELIREEQQHLVELGRARKELLG